VLVSTFAHADEMEIDDGPLEADLHPDCGRYGLRVKVVLGDGLLLATDGVYPGCMPIGAAEEEALRALHADAAREGTMPRRVIYDCVRPMHGLTDRGRDLLAGAAPDSPLRDREEELREREVVAVELGRRRLRDRLRRLRAPMRRAA
jgi:hypothetical protein